MQLAFRESNQKWHDRRISVVAGFVDCMPGELPAEGMVQLLVRSGGSDQVLDLGAPEILPWPDRQYDPNYLGYGMGSFVTQSIWRFPENQNVLQLYCREVRMQSRELLGQVYAVEGLVVTATQEPDYEAISIFKGGKRGLQYVGRLGHEVRPDWNIPPMVNQTMGESLAAFFRMPLWGFGQEPVGMVNTMHPKVCDLYDLYHYGPKDAQDERIEDFMRQAGLAQSPLGQEFSSVVKELQKAHPGYLEGRRSATPETRSEMDVFSWRMSVAVKKVLDANEDPSP